MSESVRDRHQLVVALGEGEVGAERKAAIVAFAAAQELTVSAWARQVLLAAAGVEYEGSVTREEFNALSIRVRRLESQVRI